MHEDAETSRARAERGLQNARFKDFKEAALIEIRDNYSRESASIRLSKDELDMAEALAEWLNDGDYYSASVDYGRSALVITWVLSAQEKADIESRERLTELLDNVHASIRSDADSGQKTSTYRFRPRDFEHVDVIMERLRDREYVLQFNESTGDLAISWGED